MLEFGFHQGAGLSSHMPQNDLQLLAMASTQDTNGGMETLWQLCLHLQHLGYPVVVLDATAPENPRSPGLQQLLAHSARAQDMRPAAGATNTLAVLPAKLGLQTLLQQAEPGQPLLPLLQPLLRSYALVVLHAPIDVLASPLLDASLATPLILMPPGQNGVIATYRQLKLLALHAGLNGLVACMARSYPAQQLRLAQDSLESLRRCAMRHLGQQPHTTLIRADRPQELQRLALQWLENACTISAPGTFSALPSIPKAGFPTYIAQSH